MIVEVAGVFTWNKGAELMLCAVRQHFSEGGHSVKLAVDRSFGSYEDRAKYSLLTAVRHRRVGRSLLSFMLMPGPLRAAYGLVSEADVDVVLDASGFAFGDTLGPERIEEFARDVSRWRKQGKRIVLLPQALGPFERPRIRRAFLEILENVDLVFARDPESQASALSVGSPKGGIRLCPDFTGLVKGRLPPGFTGREKSACVVPNLRMIEATPESTRREYIPFLSRCVDELERCGLDPFVLVHSADDVQLVEPLEKTCGRRLSTVRVTDPCEIKGVLGTATVVIASRFHALVSALSEGVPCLGAGWSHKYRRLFDDFAVPECLLDVNASSDSIRPLLHSLVSEPTRHDYVNRLRDAAGRHRAAAQAMWSEVDDILGLGGKPS